MFVYALASLLVSSILANPVLVLDDPGQAGQELDNTIEFGNKGNNGDAVGFEVRQLVQDFGTDILSSYVDDGDVSNKVVWDCLTARIENGATGAMLTLNCNGFCLISQGKAGGICDDLGGCKCFEDDGK